MSEPQTTYYLGHVNWDSSYRDVRLYDSATAQNQGILAQMLPQYTTTGNTFFRNHVRRLSVGFRADVLQADAINYMAWRNGTTGKWWYAFVQEIQYVNDDTSHLLIEIDEFQTWWFSVTPKACFVEREHTNDDTIGANILDEPVDTGELYVNETRTTDALKEYVVVICSAEEPTGSPTDLIPTKRMARGGWSDTMYEGCGMFLFESSTTDVGSAYQWVEWLSRAGGGNSIAAMFMYPSVFVPSGTSLSGANVFDSTNQFKPVNYTYKPVWAGTSLDGYTPRNNKLYTYPFSFVRASNNNASYHDYRYELMDTIDLTEQSFQIRGAFDPTGDMFLIPQGYNGQDYNMQELLSLGGYPQCSWSYNGYANWLAQNSGSIALTMIGGAAMAMPAVVGMAGGVAALGGAAETAGLLAGGAGTVADVALAGGVSNASLAAAGLGAQQVFGKGAGILDASRQSGRVRGASSNTALHGIGYGIFTVMRMSVRNQIARRIDDFFDAFGYSTQEIKVPNTTGRQSWNYVKTRNATFEGNAPARSVALINSHLDAGVTFWHTDDIGNYSLSNGIV